MTTPREIAKRKQTEWRHESVLRWRAPGRASFFLDAIAHRYQDRAELVGLCDVSRVRMDWYIRRLQARYQVTAPPAFPQFGWRRGDLPRPEKAPNTFLALPFSSVMTEAQLEYICDHIRERANVII